MRGVVTYDTFSAVISRIASDPFAAEVILATGDLVQDETRAGYELFKRAMAPLNRPVLTLPGNHDSPDLMQELLTDEPFRVNGSHRFGDWSIVMLSSFTEGGDAGRLSDEELERLDRSLADNADAPTLICLHHQPIPMGSRWLDGVGLLNAHELLERVDAAPQVRGILWGHVHQASDRQRQGVRLMSTPSTCSQFLPNSDDFQMDSRPPAYRRLELRADGTIDSEVVWLD